MAFSLGHRLEVELFIQNSCTSFEFPPVVDEFCISLKLLLLRVAEQTS